MRALVLAAVLGLMGSKAEAAQFSLGEHVGSFMGETWSVVSVAGPIEPGDDAKFRAITSGITSVEVSLSSHGGDVAAALEMGKTVHEMHWWTSVPENSVCASACALIWLAGEHKEVGFNGHVGFHAARLVTEMTADGATNAVIGAYLGRLGYSDQEIAAFTSAKPTDIKWLQDIQTATPNLHYSSEKLSRQQMSQYKVVLGESTRYKQMLAAQRAAAPKPPGAPLNLINP